jgi:aerobic carbon-monoxide dehydrogenase medium subunit
MTALDFHRPATLDEAVAQLAAYGDEAKVVAGSTALAILLRQRLIAPRALVSIGHLPGLSAIEVEDGVLVLGALVTHRQVELSDTVREALPVVAETFGRVANVRIRNAATVGGVVAEADYASDPPCVFVALDAEIEAVGPGGVRRIPAGEFFLGFYTTALEPAEVVTAVRVPLLAPGSGAVYEKFVTRSSEDRPCVGVAAVVRLGDDGTIADLRVAVGAAAELPNRHRDVEEECVGRTLDEALATEVAEAYAERVDPLDDLRGSAWYRREMVRVWVRRGIMNAAARAEAGR